MKFIVTTNQTTTRNAFPLRIKAENDTSGILGLGLCKRGVAHFNLVPGVINAYTKNPKKKGFKKIEMVDITILEINDTNNIIFSLWGNTPPPCGKWNIWYKYQD